MTVSPDDSYSLLADRRRRYLLVQFLETRTRNVEELAGRIAAWEQETTVEAVSEDERRTVQIALHHNHVPRLADHGVLEYDARSGAVVRRDGFEELRSMIEDAASQIERRATVTIR